ncbi:MAG: exonuclease domain-containing protein [Ktedonobacterales bacterium]
MRTQPVRVAIDLETTGLHPEQDAVIEIGALKFAGEDVLETFESFVAPGMSIPYRVQRLTGITPAQLAGAPTMGDLLPQLRAFLGDLPLVGHSVPFDAAFLRRYGLARRNPLVDTFELASTLLPNLSSYTLASVGATLGVSSPVYHRALADAQLSRDVFVALLAHLDNLDASTLEALGKLATPQDWTPGYFIRAAVRAQRGSDAVAQLGGFASLASTTLGAQLANKLGMDPRVLSLAITPQSPARLSRPLLNASTHSTIATGEMTGRADLPSPSAANAEEQVRTVLTERVHTCFASEGVLLADAQNDVATLAAALAPALQWAKLQQQHVLVSVADGESMGRFTQRVLPEALARAALTPADIPLAELNEQESYLCLHRWFGVAREARNGVLPLDVARGLAKLTVWAGKTETGVRTEVSLSGQEIAAWERARSGVEFADTVSDCAYRRDGYCFFARAQQAAERALLVITTHQALAAHISGADHVLPDATRVLILDAHLLEEELRRVQSVALDRHDLLTQLMTLAGVEDGGARSGLLHLAAERAQHDGGRAAQDAQNRERSWFAQVERARQGVERFFTALRTVLLDARGESADVTLGTESPEQRTLRIDASTYHLESWREAMQSWSMLDDRLASVVKVARDVAQQRVAAHGSRATAASDGIATDLLALARLIEQTRQQGTALMYGSSASGDDVVRWLRIPYGASGASARGASEFQQNRSALTPPSGSTKQQRQQRRGDRQRQSDDHVASATTPDALDVPALHSVPVQVGDLLKPLYAAGHALALVGPSLAVGGDFSFTCGALGLPEQVQTFAPELDRTEQTLLCLPTDVPEPNAPQYQRHLDDALVRLAVALQGRTVAIFPSHAALRASAVGIRRALERHNILVLAQGQDGSARQLWQTFRSEPRVVLLGAGAFWEGAEQPDVSPACVVVTRIPFPALSDSLLAARADVWPDRQSQFVVPHAALRLRQALGGLAWSHWRRNVVVIFDRRVQTRDFGPSILSAVARSTSYQERMEQIAERAAEWVTQLPSPASPPA